MKGLRLRFTTLVRHWYFERVCLDIATECHFCTKPLVVKIPPVKGQEMSLTINIYVVLVVLGFSLAGCQNLPKEDDKKIELSDAARCFVAHIHPEKIENVKLIQNASAQGNMMCRIYLADLYENGRGLAQDIAHAKALYLSVAQENSAAYFQLGRLAEEGIGEPVDYQMARDYYGKAAALPENYASKVRLAQLLETGKGGAVDLYKAMALYVSASKNDAAAREGIRRLQLLGVRLSGIQRENYEDAWIQDSLSSLDSTLAYKCIALLRPESSVARLGHVKIKIRYVPGTLLAQTTLLEGSNDKEFDLRLLNALVDYSFPYEPILNSQEKSVSITTEVDPYSLPCN